jgi:hypothetical protein
VVFNYSDFILGEAQEIYICHSGSNYFVNWNWKRNKRSLGFYEEVRIVVNTDPGVWIVQRNMTDHDISLCHSFDSYFTILWHISRLVQISVFMEHRIMQWAKS